MLSQQRRGTEQKSCLVSALEGGAAVGHTPVHAKERNVQMKMAPSAMVSGSFASPQTMQFVCSPGIYFLSGEEG